MEDPEEEEWEYEEDEYYYYYTTKKESNFNWFLRKGFSFGKNAVITGVVISSAPLFLPSLVVVSALGFAVSVPAGVVLATYTCTEKLMSMLLPLPAYSYTIFEEDLRGDDFEHFEVGRTDQVDSFSIEVDAYEQMNNVMVSKAAECKPENAGEEVLPVLDVKKVVDNDVSRDKSKGVKRNKKKSKYSCLKISHRIGERGSKKEILLKNHNGVKSEVQNLVPILEMKSSLSPKFGNGIFKESEVALYNVPKEDDDSYKINAKIASNEVLGPGEKTLWDKVDGLRSIVGYNAARKPSLSEELRVLYVFTGIDPKLSSFNNSNSGGHVRRTVEEKLRFLMSVIGVM